MRRKRIADVLIVGAGPVGSSIACRLAERGLDISLLDDRFEVVDERPGTVLLYRDTLDRLRDLGIRSDALGPTRSLERVSIHSGGERKASLTLRSNGSAPLVARLADVDRALARRIREEKIHVAFRQRVCSLRSEPHGVDLQIGDIEREPGGYAIMRMEEVVGRVHDESAAWVVGADGENSIVRSRLDLDLEPLAEAALYAALELRTPGPADDEMRIILDDDIAATSWPLPTGGHRYTLRLPDTKGYREELRAIKPEPTVRHLMELLSRRLPWFDADPDDLAFARVEHLRPSAARKIGAGRVWLAGEAAHRVDPLAGRSLNEGLLEAERLAHRIASALDGTVPSASLGGAYEEEVRETLAPVVDPGRCFDPRRAQDPFLAESFGRIVPLLPAEGDELDRLSAELGFDRRRAA